MNYLTYKLRLFRAASYVYMCVYICMFYQLRYVLITCMSNLTWSSCSICALTLFICSDIAFTEELEEVSEGIGSTCVCMYACVYIRTYFSMQGVCMDVCMYACTYLYIYVNICMHV